MDSFIIIAIILLILSITITPIRKAGGLLLVILGIISSLTGLGLILGIPMIFVGGILLFI